MCCLCIANTFDQRLSVKLVGALEVRGMREEKCLPPLIVHLILGLPEILGDFLFQPADLNIRFTHSLIRKEVELRLTSQFGLLAATTFKSISILSSLDHFLIEPLEGDAGGPEEVESGSCLTEGFFLGDEAG